MIPFTDIGDNDEFYGGARFIKKGTDLNRVSSEEDFFEYMLVDDLSSSKWMICVHVDRFESGSVQSYIRKTNPDTKRSTVTAKEFLKSNILDEDVDKWFYLHVENDRYWRQDLNYAVSRLDKIEFHDLPTGGLSFNFDYKILTISVELHNDEIDQYENWIIEFRDIVCFKSENIRIENDSDIEINRFEYVLTHDLFKGKMTLLSGFAKPSFFFDFECYGIKIFPHKISLHS